MSSSRGRSRPLDDDMHSVDSASTAGAALLLPGSRGAGYGSGGVSRTVVAGGSVAAESRSQRSGGSSNGSPPRRRRRLGEGGGLSVGGGAAGASPELDRGPRRELGRSGGSIDGNASHQRRRHPGEGGALGVGGGAAGASPELDRGPRRERGRELGRDSGRPVQEVSRYHRYKEPYSPNYHISGRDRDRQHQRIPGRNYDTSRSQAGPYPRQELGRNRHLPPPPPSGYPRGREQVDDRGRHRGRTSDLDTEWNRGMDRDEDRGADRSRDKTGREPVHPPIRPRRTMTDLSYLPSVMAVHKAQYGRAGKDPNYYNNVRGMVARGVGRSGEWQGRRVPSKDGRVMAPSETGHQAQMPPPGPIHATHHPKVNQHREGRRSPDMDPPPSVPPRGYRRLPAPKIPPIDGKRSSIIPIRPSPPPTPKPIAPIPRRQTVTEESRKRKRPPPLEATGLGLEPDFPSKGGGDPEGGSNNRGHRRGDSSVSYAAFLGDLESKAAARGVPARTRHRRSDSGRSVGTFLFSPGASIRTGVSMDEDDQLAAFEDIAEGKYGLGDGSNILFSPRRPAFGGSTFDEEDEAARAVARALIDSRRIRSPGGRSISGTTADLDQHKAGNGQFQERNSTELETEPNTEAEGWKCDVCGKQNSASVTRCSKPCMRWRDGKRQNITNRPKINAGIGNKPSFEEEEDEPWLCPKCGKLNDPKSRRCGRPCSHWRGGNRTNIQTVVSKDKEIAPDWKCDKCGLMNAGNKSRCSCKRWKGGRQPRKNRKKDIPGSRVMSSRDIQDGLKLSSRAKTSSGTKRKESKNIGVPNDESTIPPFPRHSPRRKMDEMMSPGADETFAKLSFDGTDMFLNAPPMPPLPPMLPHPVYDNALPPPLGDVCLDTSAENGVDYSVTLALGESASLLPAQQLLTKEQDVDVSTGHKAEAAGEHKKAATADTAKADAMATEAVEGEGEGATGDEESDGEMVSNFGERHDDSSSGDEVSIERPNDTAETDAAAKSNGKVITYIDSTRAKERVVRGNEPKLKEKSIMPKEEVPQQDRKSVRGTIDVGHEAVKKGVAVESDVDAVGGAASIEDIGEANGHGDKRNGPDGTDGVADEDNTGEKEEVLEVGAIEGDGGGDVHIKAGAKAEAVQENYEKVSKKVGAKKTRSGPGGDTSVEIDNGNIDKGITHESKAVELAGNIIGRSQSNADDSEEEIGEEGNDLSVLGRKGKIDILSGKSIYRNYSSNEESVGDDEISAVLEKGVSGLRTESATGDISGKKPGFRNQDLKRRSDGAVDGGVYHADQHGKQLRITVGTHRDGDIDITNIVKVERSIRNDDDAEENSGEISYLKSKDENSDARAKVRLTMSQHVGKRERGEKKVVESALAGADEAELRDTERNKNSGMKGMSKNDTSRLSGRGNEETVHIVGQDEEGSSLKHREETHIYDGESNDKTAEDEPSGQLEKTSRVHIGASGDSRFEFEGFNPSLSSPKSEKRDKGKDDGEIMQVYHKAGRKGSSPSFRRKRRLTEQLLSPRKRALVAKEQSDAGGGGVAFSDNLVQIHSVDIQGPHMPGLSPTPTSSLRASSAASALMARSISNMPPPIRVTYRDEKCLASPTKSIALSLTDKSGATNNGSIFYWDTLGRCHLQSMDENNSGFQWTRGDKSIDSFVESDFLGYNEVLGRVYFSSFVHRGRNIQVGDFIRRRTGNSVDYFRVAGVYQATKSFLGYWADGACLLVKSRKKFEKEQIQKRGHPYLITIPLKLKSEAEQGHVETRRVRGRRKAYEGSDVETDFGFTSCSDGDDSSKVGMARKMKRKSNADIGAKDLRRQELVLVNEPDTPGHIRMLPEWLGEEGATLEVINVHVQGSIDKDIEEEESTGVDKLNLIPKNSITDHFVCQRALTMSLRKKSRKLTMNRPVFTSLFSPKLSDMQVNLLSCSASDLLKDFITPSWDPGFDSEQVQFMNKERSWVDEANKTADVKFLYTYESSDDSDGFHSDEDAVSSFGEVVDEETKQSPQNPAVDNISPCSDPVQTLTANPSSSSDKPKQNKLDRLVEVMEESVINGSHTENLESESNIPYLSESVVNGMPTVDIDGLRALIGELYNDSMRDTSQNHPIMAFRKEAEYLKRDFDDPDNNEALPMMFVHERDSFPVASEVAVIPDITQYAVERKDNSEQVRQRPFCHAAFAFKFCIFII